LINLLLLLLLLLAPLTVPQPNRAPKVKAGNVTRALVPSATSATTKYMDGDLLATISASDPDGDKVYVTAVTLPPFIPKTAIVTVTKTISGD
jgi:hypothetical protein